MAAIERVSDATICNTFLEQIRLGIATDAKAWAKCQAIISLAHACDLKVIAEGIETEDQALLLRQFQCDYGQGWLFGEPGPLPSAIAGSTSGLDWSCDISRLTIRFSLQSMQFVDQPIYPPACRFQHS